MPALSKLNQRQVLQSRALRLSALLALVAAELAAAIYVGEHAADALGAIIMIGMAAMAGLCVALGPSYLLSLRRSKQRSLGWLVVTGALAVSAWNLSNVIDAQRVAAAALAARSHPSFAEDQARLVSLNRMIDAISDERSRDYALGNYLAERDAIQERIDAATVRPVVFASFPAWVRAFVFHGLVFGFSAAFALPPQRAPAKRKAKRATGRRRDGNVTFAQF